MSYRFAKMPYFQVDFVFVYRHVLELFTTTLFLFCYLFSYNMNRIWCEDWISL